MGEARCGGVSQAVNGCAAHSSHQVLTLGPKICSLFALITSQRLLPAFVGGVIGGAVGREERTYHV